MANYLLLLSSIGMALTQLFANFYFRPPIFFTLLGLLAVTTSIWNHGVSNIVARWLDRLYMVVYIATNTVIIYTVVRDLAMMFIIYGIMASGIGCVLTAMFIRSQAKREEICNPYKFHSPGNYYHLYSHFVVMLVHTILSYQLVQDCHDGIQVFCTDDWFSDLFLF
jgi:hypothetical protein